MVDAEIRSQLLAEFDRLSVPSQRQILEYARSLSSAKLPPGAPGKALADLFGSISDADADEMLKAIEEGCESVDPHEW